MHMHTYVYGHHHPHHKNYRRHRYNDVIEFHETSFIGLNES